MGIKAPWEKDGYTMSVNNLADLACEILSDLPNNYELSTSELIELSDDLRMNEYDINELHTLVLAKAEENDLKLDFSKYEGMIVGLPHDVPYKVLNDNSDWNGKPIGRTYTTHYIE